MEIIPYLSLHTKLSASYWLCNKFILALHLDDYDFMDGTTSAKNILEQFWYHFTFKGVCERMNFLSEHSSTCSLVVLKISS